MAEPTIPAVYLAPSLSEVRMRALTRVVTEELRGTVVAWSALPPPAGFGSLDDPIIVAVSDDAREERTAKLLKANVPVVKSTWLDECRLLPHGPMVPLAPHLLCPAAASAPGENADPNTTTASGPDEDGVDWTPTRDALVRTVLKAYAAGNTEFSAGIEAVLLRGGVPNRAAIWRRARKLTMSQ